MLLHYNIYLYMLMSRPCHHLHGESSIQSHFHYPRVMVELH